MVVPEGAVYCTLLLSDNYLPGAVILAHSLRDNGTQAKLVVLYTPETLRAATINELQTVYDVLIPVYRMTNHTPANLWLMERPDLIATFTKIELWRQTQFKRIVYIDCDVVATRAPDELLDLDVDFAAAPDVGWPDCFNSGVMVLRPNMQDYFALRALAERGTSFDGADQGLLNMHFRNWHRLSFTYNCTPSANYQYIPAYKHFQSTISMIHFIGSQKPWNMPRQVVPINSPYNELLGRWWTIYDRHYRPEVTEQVHPSSQPFTLQDFQASEPVSNTTQAHPFPGSVSNTPQAHPFPEPVSNTAPAHPFPEPIQQQQIEEKPLVSVPDTQRFQNPTQTEPLSDPVRSPQPEYQALEEATHVVYQASYAPEPTSVSLPAEQSHHQVQPEHHREQPAREAVISVVPHYVRGEEHVKTYIPPRPHQEVVSHCVQPPPVQEQVVLAEAIHPPDPVHSQFTYQPESTTETQRSPTLQPPPEVETTFEAPRAEWDASREPPPLNSKPEGIALEKKTYTMSEDHQLFQPPASYPEAPKNMYYKVPDTKPQPQNLAHLFPWEKNAPKPTRVFVEDDNHYYHRISSPEIMTEESKASQSSQPTPTSWTSEAPSIPTESFESYSRSNAWDEVPEIQKYIQSIQQARKVRVQVISGGPNQQKSPPSSSQQTPSTQHGGIRITDFPSAIERPSLPVTPAPIHRLPATGSPAEYTTDQLPAAEGVPSQEDWNPSVHLEELRRQQSDVLNNPDSIFERLTRVLREGGEG